MVTLVTWLSKKAKIPIAVILYVLPLSVTVVGIFTDLDVFEERIIIAVKGAMEEVTEYEEPSLSLNSWACVRKAQKNKLKSVIFFTR